jgi:hypothetical protein
LYTVGKQNQQKLNWLQRSLPEALVADAAWLEKNGYSGALRKKYVARGWLDQVARGVYRRPVSQLTQETAGKTVPWESVVISLQTLLHAKFVAGGRTALELQGFAHYLSSASQREVHLYGTDKRPGWVLKLNLESRFVFHNAKRLLPNEVVLDVDKANDPLVRSSYVQQRWGKWDLPLVTSSPERAILELLDEAPERETFHQIDMFFEGLRNLSPRKLQPLLNDCRRVKVKRLFLWFAERHQPAWLKALDVGSIDLGKGKRMLVKGGKLDLKFNITVPESLYGDR